MLEAGLPHPQKARTPFARIPGFCDVCDIIDRVSEGFIEKGNHKTIRQIGIWRAVPADNASRTAEVKRDSFSTDR